MMLERGFIVGATRLTKRVWQLYVAHIILFVIYIAAIGYVAQRYNDPEIINEFNVAGLPATSRSRPCARACCSSSSRSTSTCCRSTSC